MTVVITLDMVLAQRKLSSKALALAIDITPQNLSLLKRGKVKSLRLDTLDALCRQLSCQPGDLLAYRREADEDPTL